MAKIIKFTTQYVFSEDRIELTLKFDNDEITNVWLTRTLLDRLIPKVSHSLTDQKMGNEALLTNKKNMNQFAQEVAKSKLKPKKPINPKKASNEWRALGINIKKNTEIIKLTITGADENSVYLEMNLFSLRQWLNILFLAYKKAGWSLSIWPDWVSKASELKKPEEVKTLH